MSSINLQVFIYYTFLPLYKFCFIQKKNAIPLLWKQFLKSPIIIETFFVKCPYTFSSGFQNPCYPNPEAGCGTSITSTLKVQP